MKMNKQPRNSALVVVDVQNGFTPGGNLAVADADTIIPTINQLAGCFENVVLTQDWHPDNHISLQPIIRASSHLKRLNWIMDHRCFTTKHCIQGTHDAEFHPDLNIPTAQLIIRKGFHAHIDSYSAFMEADHTIMTGLTGYLKERGIDTVYVVGIATDFCVAWTALDAVKQGFKTLVIEDACKGIDLNGSLEQAWQTMQQQGVVRIQSTDLLNEC